MIPSQALVHVAGALSSSGATAWTGDGAAWLDRWVDARARKIATTSGSKAVADLCDQIRKRKFAPGEAIDIKHLGRLEDALASGTFLCNPDG